MSEEQKKLEMPPYPSGILDWNEEQEKYWKYSGETNNIQNRASFKLWNVWLAWVALRNDEKLIEIIARNLDNKDTDEFYLKHAVVSMLDRLGKVLGQTNIAEEVIVLREQEWTDCTEDSDEERCVEDQ